MVDGIDLSLCVCVCRFVSVCVSLLSFTFCSPVQRDDVIVLFSNIWIFVFFLDGRSLPLSSFYGLSGLF